MATNMEVLAQQVMETQQVAEVSEEDTTTIGVWASERKTT